MLTLLSAGSPPTANMAAWFRKGRGITVTGAGVSQWDDASGNSRHLLQGTDTNRPALQADGSILFDGSDNYLKATSFTLVKPQTIYLLVKQVTWTDGDYFFDGDTANAGALAQRTATPQIAINAGGAAVAHNSNLAVGAYGAVAVVLNGASSLIQVNATTATAGNPGTNDMSGFTLAARGDAAQFGNIQVKEAIIYAAAHDATQRAGVIAYLNSV